MILTGQALVDAAKALATRAHSGQFRADGVTPYLTHPEMVVQEFIDGYSFLYAGYGGPTNDYYRGVALAWVHDTMEHDAAHRMTNDDLMEAGLESLIPEMRLLTKPPAMSYLDYILVIRVHRKINPLAAQIKHSDFAANRKTLHMVPSKSRQKNMATKWEMAEWILMS